MIIHSLFVSITSLALIYPTTSMGEIFVSPFIYDVQNNIDSAIRIKGLASTVDIIKITKCEIMDLDSRTILNADINISDTSTVLARFETPSSLGAFKIQCSRLGSPINFDGHFLLVNSLYLIIGNVEPSTIKLGESVSFRMEVFNLTEPVPLMCHLSDGEDYIILPTNSISGNKLSTWVACPEYKLSRAAEYRITVVYSTDAIDAMLNSNNFKIITVQSDRPKIIKSGFTKDLRTIWFQFDQNVEGPESCVDIFTSITLIHIGYDAVCWFSSDHLMVLLGYVKTIKDNKITIQFSSSNGIRNYKSWPTLSSTMLNHEIIVPILPSEVTLPMYWWYGPRQYCNIEDGDNLRTPSSELPINDCIGPQAINVFPVGSLMLRYSTVLSVNDVSNSAHMSIDESSHRASLLRDSVKDLVKTMKRQNFTVGVCLNSALMLSYVEYTLEVFGTNILNQSGPKSKLKFKLIETNGMKSPPKLQIIARPTFAIGYEAVFETVLYPICSETNDDNFNNLQYSWYFIIENIKYSIIGVNGPVLILDTTNLSRGKNYTVGCELYNEIAIEKSTPAVAKDEIQFGIESFDAKTIIVPQQIVVAYGRSLYLRTKHQNYVTVGDVYYKWLCKTTGGDDCLIMGNYPEMKAAMDDKTTSSELIIRELTLQPGRYYFVVQILLSGIPIDSAVSVVVVSFELGPHIMFYWPDVSFNPSIPLPPGSSFTLAAIVSHLTSGCLTTWTTSSDSGYSYLTSKSLGGKDKVVREFAPGRNETFSRDVRFVVTLPKKIKQNTIFLFKLNVYCPFLKHSIFGIVPVSLISPPQPFKLEVTPKEGVSLVTKFRFYADVAYDAKSNHPLRCSFGFYIPTLTTKPIYFYTSAYWLQAESILPSINTSVSKIKTILKMCNIYESCSLIEGPEIHLHPMQLSDADITFFIHKYRRLLVKQMITESEAYIISVMTTLKTFGNDIYEKTSKEIYNFISTYINNNIIESLSHGRKYIPFGLTLLDSICRTFFVLPKVNNIIVSQSLISLRDRIYSLLMANDDASTSLNNIKFIVKNVNSNRRNIYSKTKINVDVVKSFLQVSEIVILNQENKPDVYDEKKKILDVIENYAKQMCLTLNEPQEVYVGSLVGSFSVQRINSASLIEPSIEIPSCNSHFHKKCIKQKSNILIDKHFFESEKNDFPLCFVGFHFYDDFFTQVYGKNGHFFKRHSGLYGFKVFKIMSNEKYSYESVDALKPSNAISIIEIPLQSTTDSQIECRYWNDRHGWTNEGCSFLGVITKSLSEYATCECPAFKYYGIFSVDSNIIPLDNSVSDSTHNTVVYDQRKNQLLNNSSLTQRSLSDIYVAFKVNGNPTDFHDQNLKDLENSLSHQLTENIKSLSSVLKELKIVLGEPMYITLHLMQSTNITTDESIQDLVKKLADGSLILYDLHRYRLYVPEQPLRIMQPRNIEFDDMGKNIALFFAIFVAFFACFVFGSILLKRHQLLTDTSDVQLNLKKEENSVKRPRYKKLESTELIEQSASSEQRFRHFNNNVELSDSGITLHSDRTQINLLKQTR